MSPIAYYQGLHHTVIKNKPYNTWRFRNYHYRHRHHHHTNRSPQGSIFQL